MSKPVNILAISGSLRSASSNTALLRAMQAMAPAEAGFFIYEGIGGLPHFNPELDKEGMTAPASVQQFRERLKAAGAVVICTPEYAAGVPGVLKNALDWIVSSGELVGKPVAAISASPSYSGGHIALASLAGTLRIMTAITPDELTLSVGLVGKKLANSRPDAETTQQLQSLSEKLISHISR